ncbi:MAG: transglycosylase SLT domain-containing protein [Fibrobacterota bacterium]
MIGSINRYQELAGAQKMKRGEKISAVSREFQQIFTEMMVKSMRSTVPSGGLVEKSMAEKMYQQMLDSEMSRVLSEQGPDVLARGIEQQVTGRSSAADHLQSLDRGGVRPRIPSEKPQAEKPKSEQKQLSPSAPKPATTALPDSLRNNPVYERYSPYIGGASQKHGVTRELITAIIQAESAGRRDAQSPVGAKGLMQLMDPTAEAMGVQNVFDPADNINGGTRYFKKMFDRYRGDLDKALAAYNAGPGNVDKYGGIPPFRETMQYVQKVKRMAGYED